jgi:hypothetical protein
MPINCDDGNACTTDSCNAATGCVYTPISCDDSNACTADSCDPATGCAHAAIVCDDGNLCTDDTCNPASGCVYTPKPIVSDNNPCTDDSCDPATGLPVYVNNTLPCDDGLFCTTNDTCSGGSCVGGANPCSDPTPVCNEELDRCEQICVKSVTIRGGGQSPNNVDLQLQTLFTVTNDGCILDSSTSTITVSVGSVVNVDCHQGTGPAASYGTWNGVPLPQDTPLTIVCPTVGDAGKLIITNKDAVGGSDTDRMTIKVQ